MKKGIIVVDIPESCERCRFFQNIYNDMVCKVNGKTINYPYPKDFKQEWCPIREMPQRKTVIGIDGVSGMRERILFGKQIGWNECIDYLEEG